jgi:hypothetical protein
MGRQQSPHLRQLGRTNEPALHDQTLFHALHIPLDRVQPQIKLFLTCLPTSHSPTIPAG